MPSEDVLVTGGTGFIGRAVTARALRLGYRVTVLDNLCTGRTANLEPFLSEIDFRRVDVLDRENVHAVMSEVRPEIVFHLAAHHFIPFCNENPIETLRVNVAGTQIVLGEAAGQNVRLAVVASTGALYPGQEGPLAESIDPAPVDIYGISKELTEQSARLVASSKNMVCIVARLFNTFGPYETNPHLIPHIIDSLQRGPVVELGNIKTKRDYIFVEDVAELLHALADARVDGFNVVNVGTGVEYSAEDIVRTIGGLLSTEVHIKVAQERLRAVDKLHQRADTQRLHALTGLTARHSLVDGMRKLLVHEGLIS